MAKESPANLERRILGEIKTTSGLLLPSFHETLRYLAFTGNNWQYDVSALKTEELKCAEKKPDKVFVRNERGLDCLTPTSSVIDDEANIRSPASWYYPLYFSWFLDGSMVLLETYENPESAVSEAKDVFVRTMELLKQETGWMPLVLEIPPLSKEMLYLNRHFLDNSLAVDKITASVGNAGNDTVAFCRQIADRVIAYH